MSVKFTRIQLRKKLQGKPLGDEMKKEIKRAAGFKYLSGEAQAKRWLEGKLADENELGRKDFYKEMGWQRSDKSKFRKKVEGFLFEEVKKEPSKQEMREAERKFKKADELSSQKLTQADIKREEEIVRQNVAASRRKSDLYSRADRAKDLGRVSAKAGRFLNQEGRVDDLYSSMGRSSQLAKPINSNIPPGIGGNFAGGPSINSGRIPLKN